jgi:hypothetical protein
VSLESRCDEMSVGGVSPRIIATNCPQNSAILAFKMRHFEGVFVTYSIHLDRLLVSRRSASNNGFRS